MSSAKKNKTKNLAFVDRFAEACGTREPARIQHLLNISYQAAKNYVEGVRYPSTEILIIIAERTGCSIHWLLTGEGKKFVRDDRPQGAPLPAGQTEEFVRRVCVEVINERFGSQGQPKVVVLPPASLREETAETAAISGENEREPDLATAQGRLKDSDDRLQQLGDHDR
jgi:hypothetical protein